MNNSKLVINNQKIKLIENRNSLQIKKGKLILNEDVTSISTDQAFSMVSDSFQSTVKIGQGLINFYLAHLKVSISTLLLPLTRDITSIIKGYSDDLDKINTLFKESVPQNVENTANLIKIANNPNVFIFSKVIETFKNVPGIDDISKIKNITDGVFPRQVKKLLDQAYQQGKNAPDVVINFLNNDLPNYMQVDSSYYEDIKNKELEDILKKIRGGEKTDKQKSISGKPIKENQQVYNNFIDLVNQIKMNDFSNNPLSDLVNNQSNIADCIYHLLTYESDHNFKWDSNNAIAPLRNNEIVRFKLDDSVLGPNLFITIKKKQRVDDNDDLKNCYIAIDDDSEQLTKNLDFYNLFIV